MSTWNNKQHEAARARCEAATEGPWESCCGAIEGGPTSGRDVVTTAVDCSAYCYGGTGRGVEHPEDREFIVHARTDLPEALGEIERLQARLTITDAMVERAAIQLCASMYRQDSFWASLSTEEKDYFRADARAALEAALNPKENES